MKKYIIYSILFALMFTSCVNDLDVVPKDPSTILAGSFGNDPEAMKQVLGKIYASFNLSGQGSVGGPDISASDDNFFTTTRALWNLQQITTDETICGWGDVGIAPLNTQTWQASNPFLTAVYQRLSLTVTYANDFINIANESSIASKDQYIAEARFLRALAYYWLMDLFANPPFTTELNGIGKFFPEQIQRADLFDYIVGELKAIEGDLLPPGQMYPQANKAAAWMLLARTYLNAEVYTGAAQWDSVVKYASMVIDDGTYTLNPNYRQNFSADNHFPANPEMIFAWESDGTFTNGYVGTTFIIESSSDAVYARAEDYHGLTENTNWNGNRARKQLMDILVDTLATYSGNVPASDTIFAQAPDGRVFLRQKVAIDIPAATSSGDYGLGVYKFTALNHDRLYVPEELVADQNARDSIMQLNYDAVENYNPAFASTDFPIFRLAEAYLMRAEANYKLDNSSAAADDINIIRERAYGDDSGNITAGQVNDDFILDELAREFYYEAHRRTDLVRFGQFTNGTYHWQWKGNVKDGQATEFQRDIFPIPADEISANPNIEQNYPDFY
jgi:hypothetical protein